MRTSGYCGICRSSEGCSFSGVGVGIRSAITTRVWLGPCQAAKLKWLTRHPTSYYPHCAGPAPVATTTTNSIVDPTSATDMLSLSSYCTANPQPTTSPPSRMLPTPLACTLPPTVSNHANPSHFRTPRTFNLLAYTAAAVCDAPRSTTSGC